MSKNHVIPKILLSIVLIPALSVLGIYGYRNYFAARPANPTPEATQEFEPAGPRLVSAEGKVAPNEQVRLGFKTAGAVEEVSVQAGQVVAAGQALARLQGQQWLQAAVEAAELELLSAQQDLQALYDNAGLAGAQARQAVLDAKDSVQQAQRTVDQFNATASKAQIEAAESEVALAEAALERARKGASDSGKGKLDSKSAIIQLMIYAAEKQYYAAVARLNALQGTMSPADQERVLAALDVAEATLEKCEREADLLASGPNPDLAALAEAQVENAQTQLAAAKTSLEDLELVTPISGTVVKLDVKPGEYVLPGTPLVVIADLSKWQVETTNLSEIDAVALRRGMKAVIVLDALPDKKFPGQVVEISNFPEELRGDVTYQVTLSFDPLDFPVRWGMTAFVDITLDE
jgi:HlyD family secretion protein